MHLYLYLKQILHLCCDTFDTLAFEYAGSLEGKNLYSYHAYSPTTCTIIIDTIIYKHVVNLLHVVTIFREVFYSVLIVGWMKYQIIYMYWHATMRVPTIVNIMARDGCFALQNVLYYGDTPFETTLQVIICGNYN